AVSQEKVDQITTNRDAIRNELHEVDAEIARRNIQAPFTGELGIRRVHLGQYLSPGDPITNLSDNSHLRVNFSLDEQAYASLSLGQAVKLRFHSHPETLFEAHVTAIDPVLDNSRMVLVQATLTETGNKQLVAGMFA